MLNFGGNSVRQFEDWCFKLSGSRYLDLEDRVVGTRHARIYSYAHVKKDKKLRAGIESDC